LYETHPLPAGVARLEQHITWAENRDVPGKRLVADVWHTVVCMQTVWEDTERCIAHSSRVGWRPRDYREERDRMTTLYLVCYGGYDTCIHIGLYENRERAVAKCRDTIMSDIAEQREYMEEYSDDWGFHKESIATLEAVLALDEFKLGGGSGPEIPWIEEMELGFP